LKKNVARRSFPIAAMFACFLAGIATGWWLHASGPPKPVDDLKSVAPSVRAPSSPPALDEPPASARESHDFLEVERRAIPLIGRTGVGRTLEADEAVDELRDRKLRLPLDNVRAESLKGGFAERRANGKGHQHEAADILAPRNTPIHAVEDGTIVKLFVSKAGGQTIYQFDPTSRFCYYYAHLERYAIGLREGQHVERGDVIGYVGTSGNAPRETPHLHFAVFILTPEKNWWQGVPLDPYLVFRKSST
jgi:murein DD-endopeptidase MepM/ murein hydrolase activator NlpD